MGDLPVPQIIGALDTQPAGPKRVSCVKCDKDIRVLNTTPVDEATCNECRMRAWSLPPGGIVLGGDPEDIKAM